MATRTILLPLALGLLAQGCSNPSAQPETPDASIPDASISDAGSTGSAAKLLFTRRIGDERHIFVAAADGTGEQQLTTEGVNFSPTWSPDGDQVAFVRGSATEPGVALRSMTSDGSGVTDLVTWEGLLEALQDGSELGGLSWSPDGANLALHAIDLWVPSVFVMPAAQDGALTKVVDQGKQPAWSPDGQQLVFTSFDGAWIANSDGSNPRQLVASSTARDPTWSPEGDLIALSMGDVEADLYTIRPDGSDLTQVTTLGGHEVHPSFSPDALTIAFSHQQGSSSEVLELTLATGATTLLVQDAETPVYQP